MQPSTKHRKVYSKNQLEMRVEFQSCGRKKTMDDLVIVQEGIEVK